MGLFDSIENERRQSRSLYGSGTSASSSNVEPEEAPAPRSWFQRIFQRDAEPVVSILPDNDEDDRYEPAPPVQAQAYDSSRYDLPLPVEEAAAPAPVAAPEPVAASAPPAPQPVFYAAAPAAQVVEEPLPEPVYTAPEPVVPAYHAPVEVAAAPAPAEPVAIVPAPIVLKPVVLAPVAQLPVAQLPVAPRAGRSRAGRGCSRLRCARTACTGRGRGGPIRLPAPGGRRARCARGRTRPAPCTPHPCTLRKLQPSSPFATRPPVLCLSTSCPSRPRPSPSRHRSRSTWKRRSSLSTSTFPHRLQPRNCPRSLRSQLLHPRPP